MFSGYNTFQGERVAPSQGQRIYNEERIVSSIIRWVKLDLSLIPYTKISPKQIKYLNIRPVTIKIPEENRR